MASADTRGLRFRLTLVLEALSLTKLSLELGPDLLKQLIEAGGAPRRDTTHRAMGIHRHVGRVPARGAASTVKQDESRSLEAARSSHRLDGTRRSGICDPTRRRAVDGVSSALDRGDGESWRDSVFG